MLKKEFKKSVDWTYGNVEGWAYFCQKFCIQTQKYLGKVLKLEVLYFKLKILALKFGFRDEISRLKT